MRRVRILALLLLATGVTHEFGSATANLGGAAPAHAAQGGAQTVKIDVLVPADATVEFGGVRFAGTGGVRRFETAIGATGTYTVKITASAGGKTASRDVVLVRGTNNTVDLRDDLSGTPGTAQPVGEKEVVTKEFKKFEGTWVLASGERDGMKLADDDVKKSKIVMKGEETTLFTPHQSNETIKSTRKLDPGKKPAHVDFVRSTDPGKGQTMKGIYEFIDADTYRVCFAPPDKDRPTEFKTTAGSGHTLHVWKRSKE